LRIYRYTGSGMSKVSKAKQRDCLVLESVGLGLPK